MRKWINRILKRTKRAIPIRAEREEITPIIPSAVKKRIPSWEILLPKIPAHLPPTWKERARKRDDTMITLAGKELHFRMRSTSEGYEIEKMVSVGGKPKDHFTYVYEENGLLREAIITTTTPTKLTTLIFKLRKGKLKLFDVQILND